MVSFGYLLPYGGFFVLLERPRDVFYFYFLYFADVTLVLFYGDFDLKVFL